MSRWIVAALSVGMLSLVGCSHVSGAGSARSSEELMSTFSPTPEVSGERAFLFQPARTSVTGYTFDNPVDYNHR